MNIYRTSFVSLIIYVLKTISVFVVNKITALLGGPGAISALGLFQNTVAISQLFSGGMYQTGVVKFVAESKSAHSRSIVASTFFYIALFQSIMFIFFTLIFGWHVAQKFIEDFSLHWSAFYCFLISVPLYAFSTLALSYLNGTQNIKGFGILNVMSSLINIVFVLLLGYIYGTGGVFLGISLCYCFTFILIFIFLFKEDGVLPRIKFSYLTLLFSKKVLSYSGITISSILISNLTIMAIRYILQEFSTDVMLAGYWQALWTLSQVTLALVTMSLSTYLLPALARAKDFDEVSKEIYKSFIIVVPFSLMSSAALFFLKDYVIFLLYSKDFYPMEDLFGWQLLGNVIKTVSWLFGFTFVARGNVKVTVSTEIIIAIIFICSCYYFSVNGCFEAPVIAYFISSISHLFLMVFFHYTVTKNELSKLGNHHSDV